MVQNYTYHRLIISGFLFVWTLTVFLPGAYSIDSWNQFKEVSSGHYDDWYGTGLATTWRCLWLLTGNYMSLYTVQMFFYWTFITLLLWPVRFTGIVYWLTLGCALFFCFIPQYVMRDSLAVLSWGLAALFLLYAGQQAGHRKTLSILGLLFLAYGVWVRINSLAAFLPLAYIAIVLLGGRDLSLWKRLLLTISTCIVLFLGIRVLTYNVQKAAKAYPEYKLKLLDLSGISRLSGENLFPPAVTHFPAFNLDTLFARYTPAGIDEIYWPDDGKPIFPYPTETLDSIVGKSWLSAIRRHPVYYLQNRFTGFLYYLRIKKRFAPELYWNASPFFIQPGGPLPAKMEDTKLHLKIIAVYGRFYGTILYAPWFWLLLNIAGFAWFVYKCRKNPGVNWWLTHACIQLSGVFFLLSQVLIYQHDRDFRYTYWNVFVVFLAIPGFFATKRQGAGVNAAP
jgi:hypothetical protein